MKLNKKVRYGLRTMIEIASNGSNDGLLQKQISKNQLIPLKFLDTIITGLRTKGLVKNYSGKHSGYILTKPASEITVYDIYCAFEPELALVDCLCEPNICELRKDCKARDFWSNLNDKIQKSLKQTTLEDTIKISSNN